MMAPERLRWWYWVPGKPEGLGWLPGPALHGWPWINLLMLVLIPIESTSAEAFVFGLTTSSENHPSFSQSPWQQSVEHHRPPEQIYVLLYPGLELVWQPWFVQGSPPPISIKRAPHSSAPFVVHLNVLMFGSLRQVSSFSGLSHLLSSPGWFG